MLQEKYFDKYTTEKVDISIRVCVGSPTSSSTKYISSDFSDYSNVVKFSIRPAVKEITLAPENPIICLDIFLHGGEQGEINKIIESKNGDFNGNGAIDQVDYDILTNYLLFDKTLSDKQKEHADINSDGVIDTFDLIYLDLYLNGQIELP